ncbi:MAG: hypothetical protein ACRDK3_10250 [Actinomycetota bacterium]
MRRCLVQEDMVMLVEERLHVLGGVSREVVHDAVAQKSGSWEVIQLRTCHGLRSRPRQMRQIWLAETPTSSASAWDTASMVQHDAGSGGVWSRRSS